MARGFGQGLERAVAPVANRLVELGAHGVIEEEVEGRVDLRRLRAHYDSDAGASLVRELDAFLSALDDFFRGCADAPIEIAPLEEEDWAEGWKQSFPPLEIGRRFRIRPPWSTEPDPGKLDVVIEPAMASCTARHPSTACAWSASPAVMAVLQASGLPTTRGAEPLRRDREGRWNLFAPGEAMPPCPRR